MTVSELYSSVARLGFEDSLDNEKGFVFAANRALLQVCALRPSIGHCFINHKPLKNKAFPEVNYPIEKIEPLEFYAENVKSYYFEADGKGVLYVYCENTPGSWDLIQETEFDGFKPYRGFIKKGGEFVSGKIKLKFDGEFLYTVRCVALYEHLYSDNEMDIPACGKYSRYDISELASDFLGLVSPPVIENVSVKLSGKYLTNEYDVENGRILLISNSISGIFKIYYKRRPMQISSREQASSNTAKIDLDEELCAVLPLLVASYVWIEDEPEKAQYYLSLYNERAFDIQRRNVDHAPVKMINITGW